jgi:aminopeptidase N
LPIRLGLVGTSGDLPLTTDSQAYAGDGLAILDSACLSITFEGVAEPPIPSLLRTFSAPVRLELDLSDAELIRQFAQDSDSFNRWQALQSVATRALTAAGRPNADRNALQATGRSLGEALAKFLEQDGLADPAFAAQVLRLPSPADTAREIGRDVDPDAVFAGHRALSTAIGAVLLPRLPALRQALSGHGVFRPDAASAGRRALRNELLGLIALSAPTEGAVLCEGQFAEADNLTDRLAALAAMTLVPGEAREALIRRFAELYKDEPLVLDKWLMAQALIPESGTLDRVKSLMQHPAFSLANPNRVRGLIGGFAANLTQFNRLDGAGYSFIADIVVALDRANPQVASRLLGSFKSWRMLEPVRRRLAQDALGLVARTPGLSRDVSDIAERTLA